MENCKKNVLVISLKKRLNMSLCVGSVLGLSAVIAVLFCFLYLDMLVVPTGVFLRPYVLNPNNQLQQKQEQSTSMAAYPPPNQQESVIPTQLPPPQEINNITKNDGINLNNEGGIEKNKNGIVNTTKDSGFNVTKYGGFNVTKDSGFNITKDGGFGKGEGGFNINKSDVGEHSKESNGSDVDGGKEKEVLKSVIERSDKPKEERFDKCDLSVGSWVWDESYPFYDPLKCPFIDDGFRCLENGRPDKDFVKWRWQPSSCNLPRFNASYFLQKVRNGRVAFVGDSIGRNQWESLVCMLAEAVPDKKRIYEVNGNPITKHKGFLSFRFEDYNCTVEYYRAPFLVYQGRPPRGSPPQVVTTLKVDTMDYTSGLWTNANVLVFNTGHWWNYEKTLRGGCYFQEGKVVAMEMHVEEALKKSMSTWADWVERNVDPTKTRVFLRSYSPVHFRDGTWKTGGQCHKETQPDTNTTLFGVEPQSNKIMGDAMSKLVSKKKVQFLNITYLSQFRKDGHSSIYYLGKGQVTASLKRQDCSHWCLPGVPDTWNYLLYGQLFSFWSGR